MVVTCFTTRYIKAATCFDDMPVKKKYGKNYVKCQVCKGHGGWVLLKDEYGPKKHFMASCSQCNGFGWVTGQDKKCIHNFIETYSTRNCLHFEECSKCGQKRMYDSSD